MKPGTHRLRSLAEACTVLIETEMQTHQELLSTLIESVAAIQRDTADRRFQRLGGQLKELQRRVDLLATMTRRDFLIRIEEEVDQLHHCLEAGRAGAVLTALVEMESPSLNAFCHRLLDRLIEATGGERGFILFYLPESTEAEVIAARHFQTRNLSLEEYDFSRSLLREAFKSSQSLLIEDASQHPVYSNEVSVRKLQLRSILISPLRQNQRTIGALYLENNATPCAFDREDLELVESVSRFVVFYFRHARLLPVLINSDNRIVFDESRLSGEMVGQDSKIRELLEMVHKLADSPATVLIEGESGSGKELVARALHRQGKRRDCPFVAINCAAIPDNLLESELFGHEKGAFTGATERRLGRIEQANGGTLFLDEVSELAYPLQAKLLRFLQSNQFERLGGKETITVDVRVVAATSKDLKAMMEAGKFQDALYYRLNVIPVRVPPLRERREDIPLLARHFLSKFSAAYGRELRIEPEVYDHLKEYSFPGNVRELENLIHRLVVLAPDETLRIGDLPREILELTSRRVSLASPSLQEVLHSSPLDLQDLRRRKQELDRAFVEQERRLVERAIQEAGGNLSEAARRLGVHRVTLHKMFKRTRAARHKQV